MPLEITEAYSNTLKYLYEQLPMFSRIGAAAIKKDLTNTIALCEALDNPQHSIKTIHIAGTNGKGSVSHMLASIFQEAGYKTGLYTSPHLLDFRERIRINGQHVSEDFVVRFVAENKVAINDIEPSFFEITVAMAFRAFAEEKVDIAIIETGLGGRLDSTNVITPELSIITNISLDHIDMLGDTISAIAGEKAGIIKQNIPVVIGQFQEESYPVFQAKALQTGSKLFEAWKRWKIYRIGMRKRKTDRYVATDKATQISLFFESDLRGSYQVDNIATVLTSVEVLETLGWNISVPKAIKALRYASATSGLRGRWEILQKTPLIVADVAHNPAGLQLILKQWQKIKESHKRIVIGFVRDKDVRAALSLFPKDNTYYFCAANIPRALPAAELAAIAADFDLVGNVYSSVEEAVQASLEGMEKDHALLVSGSFFIVAEALQFFEERMGIF